MQKLSSETFSRFVEKLYDTTDYGILKGNKYSSKFGIMLLSQTSPRSHWNGSKCQSRNVPTKCLEDISLGPQAIEVSKWRANLYCKIEISIVICGQAVRIWAYIVSERCL